MAGTVLVDSGFLVALLNRRDTNHEWAHALARRCPPPWITSDAALSETFYLLGTDGLSEFVEILRRGAVTSTFRFIDSTGEVLELMQKYADVPMALADACLVRMSEILPDPIVLTTDSDFRIYRRHGRKALPCIMPNE